MLRHAYFPRLLESTQGSTPLRTLNTVTGMVLVCLKKINGKNSLSYGDNLCKHLVPKLQLLSFLT